MRTLAARGDLHTQLGQARDELVVERCTVQHLRQDIDKYRLVSLPATAFLIYSILSFVVLMYRAMLQSEHGKLDTLRQDYTALQQSVGGLQVLDTLFNVPGADPATLLELVGSRLVAASEENESLRRQVQELQSRASEAVVRSEVVEVQKVPPAPTDPSPSSADSDAEVNATDQRDQLMLLQGRIADLQKQLVDRELSSDLAPLQDERRADEWEQQRNKEREEAAARVRRLQDKVHTLEMENSRLEQDLFARPIPITSQREPSLRSDSIHTDDKGDALASAKDEVRRLKSLVQERNCQLNILTDTVAALQKAGAQYPAAGAKGGLEGEAKASWAVKSLIERLDIRLIVTHIDLIAQYRIHTLELRS